jgi:hypothetical protein
MRPGKAKSSGSRGLGSGPVEPHVDAEKVDYVTGRKLPRTLALGTDWSRLPSLVR